MLKKAHSMVVPGTLIGILALLILGSAPAPAEEIALGKTQVLRLLADMSTLDAAAIRSRPGMTPEAASRILAFREKGGRFASVEELRSVAGLTEDQFGKLAAFYRLEALPDPELDRPAGRKEGAPTVRPGKSGAAAERRGRLSGTGMSKAQQGAAAGRSKRGGLGLTIRPHYYSILSGYDLSILTEGQRKAFLERINTEECSCGGKTLAYCYVNDPECPVAKARVAKIYEDIVGKPPPPANSPGER